MVTAPEKQKVNGLLQPISATLNIDEILQIACDTIIDFFDEDVIIVSIVLSDQEKRKTINLKAFSSHSTNNDKTKDKKLEEFKSHYQEFVNSSYENTAYSKCIKNKAIITDDLSQMDYKESALLLEQGIGHRVIFPIISTNTKNTLGTLNIGVKSLDGVDAAKTAIEEITKQLANAIENSERFYQVKSNAEKSLQVNKLFYEINKTQDIDTIITTVVKKLGKIMNCSRSFFAGIARESWIIQAEYTAPGLKKVLGLTGPLDLGLDVIERSLSEGYIIINDIEKELKPKSEELYQVYKKLDVKSFIYLPIKMKGKVCGMLGLSQKDYHRIWSKDDIKLLEIIRDQVSICISQAQLINDLKQSNEKLLELDRLKSQLMSTVSHELRTPMANILGFSELLLHRDYAKETSQTYIQEIHTASHRLSNLIQDFLDLSRIEATGKIPLGQFEEIEIDWIAENAWAQLGSQKQKHEIKWIKSKELPPSFADPEALNRVFSNLFSNAIKYSEEGTTIRCSIEANRNDIFICVADEGIGIPENMQNSIFDRFFRIDNSDTRSIGGTGLGLSICKEILNAHGGQIWCESEEGKGSKFFFTLPLNQGDRDLENSAQIWLC